MLLDAFNCKVMYTVANKKFSKHTVVNLKKIVVRLYNIFTIIDQKSDKTVKS